MARAAAVLRAACLGAWCACCVTSLHHGPLLSYAARQQLKAATAATLASATVLLGGLQTPPAHLGEPDAPPPAMVSLRPPSAQALTEEQEIINEAWKVVNQAFVDKTFSGRDWKAERLKAIKGDYRTKADAYAAAKAMLATLGDPYTRFLSPSEYDTLAGLARGSTAASTAGIGVEMVYASDLKPLDRRAAAAGSGSSGGAGDCAAVASVVPGAPAEAAGVRANDAIVAVDGEQTRGMNLDAVAALLRGPPGTEVRVTLERAGRPVDVTVGRAEIKFQGVTDELATFRGRKVGLITIKTFSKETARDLAAAVHRLDDLGATAWVLDLRHNPGGFFPGGIDSARVFLRGGLTIVSVVDRNGIGDSFETPDDASPLTDRPVALVVDDRTASASEVFAAALRDNSRAALVGRRTFGKARIQTLNQLSDGSGVAVTVSVYTTPRGADINKIGIPVDAESECAYPGPALECIPPAVKL